MSPEQVFFNNNEIAWKFIPYTQVEEPTGVLAVMEYQKEIDFDIKRLFFLRDIKEGASRGFHSHKELKQYLFCAQGRFEIELDNGLERHAYSLDKTSSGILIDGKVWREMKSFSSDCVMVVLCDREYRFDEVVRDYGMFLENIKRFDNEL